MHFLNTSDIAIRELFPGFDARLIHTNGLTIGHIYIKAGSALPTHSHMHEQISNIIEGEFEMTVGDETRVCRPGDVAVIPGHVPHSGRAITDCYIVDVFRPVREDYK